MAAESVPKPTSGVRSSAAAAKGGKRVAICQDMIRRSLTNPMVKFLIENLEKSGCSIGKNFIKAVHCGQAISSGYIPAQGIMVCSNHMNFQYEVDEVLIHELIHAYDDCRANLDWTNCAHHACSEIRASHLSGDCHHKRELLRGFINMKGHEQECVRRRAMKSVLINPFCSQAAAKAAMEAVWDVCYNDTKPFDKAP